MARAGLTVDRVVRAAADLADEVGFENVTVSALARHFGVADASLYSHVKGLGDLRARVAMLTAGELAQHMSAAVAGRAGKEALRSFAHAYRKFALAYPGRYTAVQMRLPADVVAESADHRCITDCTYAILLAYGLAEPDLTDAVRLLRSTFHGYVSLESTGGFGAPREVQSSWEQAIEALHMVLEHWPSSLTQPTHEAIQEGQHRV
ncbi:TetR/AcrR family transcriptional regulator [Streptomyces sp. DT24]|uniref:TetR/AcrR family transcriptional regulator n=1 Tax=unclassified Streptomyces TaxID=2593676 RepID=UPI003CF3EAA4